MRIPVPNNTLVALTALGAMLTAVVAVGLAVPGSMPGQSDDAGDVDVAGQNLSSDAPPTNENFTPAVQTPSYEEHEEEEYEEHEEEEYEEHEEEEYEEEREDDD